MTNRPPEPNQSPTGGPGPLTPNQNDPSHQTDPLAPTPSSPHAGPATPPSAPATLANLQAILETRSFGKIQPEPAQAAPQAGKRAAAPGTAPTPARRVARPATPTTRGAVPAEPSWPASSTDYAPAVAQPAPATPPDPTPRPTPPAEVPVWPASRNEVTGHQMPVHSSTRPARSSVRPRRERHRTPDKVGATIAVPGGALGQPLDITWAAAPDQGTKKKRRTPLGAIVAGTLGELLITLGCVLALFVGWEVVWSSVATKPLQNLAIAQVHDRPGYIAPASGKYAPEYQPDTAPTDVGSAKVGKTWLSLHVPRWGYSYNVAIAEGTDKATVLDKGLIGHYIGTQNVGQLGNFALAAHRITYGEPFAKIQQLRDGDLLIVESDKYYFVYKVYAEKIVAPTDMAVIWPVPYQANAVPTRRLITLTTCHPRYASTSRYIVWGDMQYWTKKSEGKLQALTPPGKQ